MDAGTVERCRHAAIMPAFLLELNGPAADVAGEGTSRTTSENAVECRRLLEPQGVRKTVRVTDAVPLKRARACREAAHEWIGMA
jgi:uncharacterized SAM-binding protein YcdF (DUF218 family)